MHFSTYAWPCHLPLKVSKKNNCLHTPYRSKKWHRVDWRESTRARLSTVAYLGGALRLPPPFQRTIIFYDGIFGWTPLGDGSPPDPLGCFLSYILNTPLTVKACLSKTSTERTRESRRQSCRRPGGEFAATRKKSSYPSD